MAGIEAVEGTPPGTGIGASGAVRALPITAVAIAAIAVWLIAGVALGDLARFAGYEIAFVLLPGALLLRAILPGLRSPGWMLALACPVGLALGIVMFSLTAVLDVRGLYALYPIAVGAPAAVVIWARRGDRFPASTPDSGLPVPCAWALAALCLVAFAYVGVNYFGELPIPGSEPAVIYSTDVVSQITLVNDALHHWPIGTPNVAGEPLGYHYFVHLHMAGISQVTGIHPSLVVFRLFLVPLLALAVLQMGLSGRVLTGRAWAAPLAAALLLLVRGIDASVSDALGFDGTSIFGLVYSPSELLGVTFFVPILVVLSALLDPAVMRRIPFGSDSRASIWGVLIVLLAVAGGAKSVILPLLIGGLILYLLWARLRHAPLDPPAITALGLCVILFVAYEAILYRQGAIGLRLDLMSTIKQMPTLVRLHSEWPGGLPADVAYWALAIPAGLAMFFAAPVIGVIFALRGRPLDPAAALAVSLLLTGMVPFFVMHGDSMEQLYFTQFGLFAILPLAAGGLMRFFQDPRRRPELDWRRLSLLGALWVAAVVVLALLTDPIALVHPIRADALLYGPLVLAGALLVAVAGRARGRLRARVAGFAVLALFLTAALDTPLDFIPQTVRLMEHHQSLYGTSPITGLHRRELRAMEWMRDHLDGDAVLAVSNDSTPNTQSFGPVDLTYPAFTERRTFREGWLYSPKGNEAGTLAVEERTKDPFPERHDLERAVFRHADRGALRTMIDRYGVSDIVVSRKSGAVNRRVYDLGTLVYSNGAVDVIRLPGPS